MKACKCKHWRCYVCAVQSRPRFSVYQAADGWLVRDHNTNRNQGEGLTQPEADLLCKHLNNEGK